MRVPAVIYATEDLVAEGLRQSRSNVRATAGAATLAA
jgi:hypothetical protein